VPTAATARIIQPSRNAGRIVSADRAGVLVDGADYYRAFYWAARRAERYILMSGWQFDSGVQLVRGDEAAAGEEVRFLKFLNGLCERSPTLHVYLLAWDFHPVLGLEREWWQRVYFHWKTNSRLHFHFDACEVDGGSHHQKFVVIDGALAFRGGMDVCEARWDDRRHLAEHPLRYSHGRPQKPYHEVQAFVAGGDAPTALGDLFVQRWARAGGDPLVLPPALESPRFEPPPGLLPLPGGALALSRTDPRRTGSLREVEQLLVDAIGAAEQCVYAETQYFSSRRIFGALVSRMQAAGRPKLEIVVIVNERAEAIKEELAVGLRQAEILEKLREVAGATGHALGIYWSRPEGKADTFPATYIHSKLTIVDDRFLSVGSANLTNRSMGVDSELHASWEASPDDAASPLAASIRDIRLSLLAEHSGRDRGVVEMFGAIPGLVGRLDAIIADRSRLRRHGPPRPAQRAALQLLDPQSLPFDPSDPGAADAAALEEPSDQRQRGKLPSGLASAGRWLAHRMRRG
jgi:phosphatidylserine/phosphatidylglycerophosphate/cardiolipin synthase-like enzyme